MSENNHHTPELGTLTRKIIQTGLGALGNRGELLAVEWQEERARLVALLLWGLGFLLLGILAIGLLTATVIFLFPLDRRIYVAAGFAMLYLLGAIAALVMVKSLLKYEPFGESIAQVKKDRLWVQSLE
jgi:uncharacterized membrane protein YqjE